MGRGPVASGTPSTRTPPTEPDTFSRMQAGRSTRVEEQVTAGKRPSTLKPRRRLGYGRPRAAFDSTASSKASTPMS